MNKVILGLSLITSFFLVDTSAFAQSKPAQLRVVDILDGFAPGQYDFSSVEFGKPDKIVPWSKGDLGVASLTRNDIHGNPVRDIHIFIYKEGEKNGEIHDAGAHGGAKIVREARIEEGVNCLSDGEPFAPEYIKVIPNDVLCIKVRDGKRFVLAKVLETGSNGIKLRIYGGPQEGSYFPALENSVHFSKFGRDTERGR